jgi:hypothetical protein
MRTSAIVAGAVCAVCVCLVSNRSNVLANQKPEVDPVLLRAIEARFGASDRGNAGAYARTTWDDAILVLPGGSVSTTAARLAAIKGSTPDQDIDRKTEEQFRVYGDTVIQTFRQEVTNAAGRQPTRHLLTWVKQNGQWRRTGRFPQLAESLTRYANQLTK